jgi:hypothetical protein
MAGKKGRSGGPRANSGGRRAGAGRPRKEKPTPAGTYDTAEEYLRAVICGREPPDADRISAARCLIRYQSRPARAPLAPAATPRELDRRTKLQRANAHEAELQRALDEVARRYGER